MTNERKSMLLFQLFLHEVSSTMTYEKIICLTSW